MCGAWVGGGVGRLTGFLYNWLCEWCLSLWRGWGSGWRWRLVPLGNCLCGVCVRGVWVKDRVGGGDWLLRSRALMRCRSVGEFGCVRVYVFAEWSGCSVLLCLVLVLRCVRVVVYVNCVRCTVVLHCIVGWGVIMGLTGAVFVVLKARGAVTGGVA